MFINKILVFFYIYIYYLNNKLNFYIISNYMLKIIYCLIQFKFLSLSLSKILIKILIKIPC